MPNRIEQTAIIIAAVVGLVMAAAGWLGYYVSGAEVLLLDGNFSFIAVLATLIALRISIVKTRVSKTYPFGKFAYEPAYSLFIGLLTAGVILVAAVGNSIKIVDYFQGAEYPVIDTSIILVYAIVMMVLCFGLALLFGLSNRRLKGNSTILGAYTVQATIDGLLSAGAGGALIGFSFIAPDGAFGFLTQIGDAIVVLLLCLLVVYQPVKLMKSSFIELSGGALQDAKANEKIRSCISKYIEDSDIADLFTSKTGSVYLVFALMKASFFDVHDSEAMLRMRKQVTVELKKEFSYVAFEFTLEQEPPSSEGD